VSDILYSPSSSTVASSPGAGAGGPSHGRGPLRGGTRRRGRPRARSRRRRCARWLSSALLVLGVLVLFDAGVTLVWQEPLSALYAKFEQDHLRGTLRAIERAQPTAAERAQLVRLSQQRRIAFLAWRLQRHAAPGSPVGTIHIPRIGADFVVVAGTGTEELEKGPGVYPETHFPGLGSTTAIAGHRTTWLAPFRRIDELRVGDRIELDMPYAHFLYTVTGHRVVLPTDVRAAIAPVSYSRLVLSACTPLFSAAKRMLVYARLRSTVPVGAALGGLHSATPIGPALRL
jgi:sortase A